ncbi:MAG: hypothetical protein JXN63_02660 [Candidatus Delongbacteria bacterium]|nr:hypothetical protein [Candidatus Delongbacteria bacterium]
MKKIAMLTIVVIAFVLSAQMEEYDRKSISVFKLDVLDGASMATDQDVNLVYDMVFKKFTGMGRFDYNPIPAGVTDPAQLFSIVKEYTATKIEERAAKQWNIKNEYYGTNFVTGENVDKIINGAYIFFPTLETFVVTKKKDSDDFTASMSVILEVYSAENKGTVESPVWEPVLVTSVRAAGSNAMGALFDFNLKGEKKDKRYEAVKSATNAMLLFLEKEVRKIDAFTIKALVTKAEPKKDKISFNFGKNVGVNLDDAYRVGYFVRDDKAGQKFVETGFMKVRKVKEKESESQLLIVTNPKREKEESLFNEMDQVYEYPQVGLNIFFNAGANSFKYWSDVEAGQSIEDAEELVSPFVGVNLEYNVAKYIGISELYLNVSADALLAQLGNVGVNEFETSTAVLEFGITKKFFSRKIAYYFGIDGGYMALTSKTNGGDEENLYAVGGKVKGGINYMLGKNWLFDAGVAFRGYSELMNEDGEEYFADSIYEGEGWLTPSGFVFRVGLGFTL